MIIQPNDGGDDVFCNVRGLKDGEGSVYEGNTAKPKVSFDEMLATSLTRTAKQRCEPQARAAASRCMMRRGHGRASPRFQKALWCQEITEQGRLLDLAQSDTKTLSADRIVHPTRRCRAKPTWQAGNGLSTESAGEPWSRARDDTKKGVGNIQV